MVTSTLTKLTEIVVDRPAPMPDGKNLWFDIDVNLSKLTALIHSREEEFVGTHKKRTVTFRADEDCVVFFTNANVFSLESVQLFAHRQVILPIKDTTTNVTTFYDICVGTSIGESAEMQLDIAQRSAVTVRGGPHIVVP